MEPSVITSCPGDMLMLLQVVVVLQPWSTPPFDEDDVVSVFVFVLIFIVVEEA